MDKKRVFNAAVTAGLSLSMVLTSVPATALANVVNETESLTSTRTVFANITFKDSASDETSTYKGDLAFWYVDPTATGMFEAPEGMVFSHWSYDEQGSEQLTPDSMPAGDVTLWAQWKKVESPEVGDVTVTYKDSLDPEATGTVSNGIPSDSWYVDPSETGMFSHDGYEFVGWSYDQDGTDPLSPSDTPSGAMIIWAQWKKVEAPEVSTVTVTYKDSLDPEATGTVSNGIPSDSWYVDPSETGMFSHDGYEFVGWSYDQDGTDPLSPSDTPSGAMIIWAQWKKVESEDPEPTSKVTMVYRDSLNADWAGQTSYGIDNDVWYFDPTGTVGFVHPGYKFVGWSYDQAGTDMLDESSRPLSADPITVWAQWEQIELGDVTVTYKDSLDPEAIGTTSYDIPSDLWYVDPVAMNMFAHPGYEFVGWSYDQEGTDMLAQNATPSGDMVIWAQWKKVESPEVGDVTVTYKDSLDPEAAGSKSYDIPSDSWYVDPTETGMFDHYGYKFVGWSYNQDGTDPIDPSAQPTGDMVIWAQWEQIELGDVTVTYKDSLDPEAAGSKSYDIPSDSWYVDPTETGMFTHPGYEFVGWSYNQDGTDPLSPSDTPSGDMVIWAQWKKVESPEVGDVTVTYKDSLDPEAAGSKSYDIPSDSWYVDPTETGMFDHYGYKFVGWSYNQDGTDPIDPSAQPTGDMVIWAQWEAVEMTDVTVTYKDALDPENPGSKSYDVPSNLWYVDPVATGMFSHDGYEFVGWSYNQDGTDPLSPTDMPAGDMVIWAQWKKIDEPVETHTVTFVDKYNGTQSTVTVENGDVVIAPVDPSYPGFTFVGWSTDGFEYVSYDFSTPVTGDLVLYASYSKNAEPSTPGDDQPSTPAPGDEVSPEQAASDSKKEDSNVPETGDATNAVAVTGIGIAGLMAAAASFILRRRNEQ